ncbi:ena/VASP-like protein isoform X2 [Siniperca chuatsi]|uniref:ena/VASP-like protein isoform X2 n=1 Tax=Siniperca chuatsi TaxID=119488 RepID=UPI001CE121D2|nr:ena/VASP-like protein isoform X2 [Siniperca chuatsi]
MSTRRDGGGRGGREFFVSAHRCPEVDLLPHHDSETQIPPPCSLVPVEKSSEFTYTGQSEANYLDVSSICRSEEEEGEEEEGSISDWSEEDLSLHFSPSVILPSDDEESDPESGFECVDITLETQVKGQDGEGLKMVPKRQIQLKKKDAEKIIDQEKTEKLQVITKDGPAEGGGVNSEVSANELLCPTVRHRPDLLLRQHSMPTSLHTRSTTSSDADSYRVYKGLVAAASQGFHVEGNLRQRLQKSFSLDETKTKMASCIIKNVLSKKMQVEQNNSKTSYLQKKPVVLPGLPQPAEQQRMREGEGALTTTRNNNKPTSFKVIGQEDSPPPTYQQAVGVKSHNETKRSCQASVYSSSTGGHVAKVAASLSQSQDSKQSNISSCPITQQRRGSEPIISRSKMDDVTWPDVLLDPPPNSPVCSDPSELSQSERARGVGQQAGTSLPPLSTSISRHPQETQPLLSAQEQSAILGVSFQFVPNSSQPLLHSCFYTPTLLSTYPTTLYPHLGKASYVHSHLSYIQTQPQPPPPAPNLHLLRRSEENQSRSTGNTSDQLDHFIKTCPPHQTRSTIDQGSDGDIVTPATKEQHEQQKLQQQQFLCSFQGSLPAQVDNGFVVDVTGSAAARLSGPAPCHVMLDPKIGRCFYVDTPPQPQRKMLLDPETGQYIQVFLPAASSSSNTGVFPVCCANPASILINPAPSATNPAPAVLSAMQFQPTVAMSSLYTSPCLPFTVHTPSVNFTHTAP